MPSMTDLQMLGNSFCEFGLVLTYQSLVLLFDPKVHLFESSLLKILAHLPRSFSRTFIQELFDIRHISSDPPI